MTRKLFIVAALWLFSTQTFGGEYIIKNKTNSQLNFSAYQSLTVTDSYPEARLTRVKISSKEATPHIIANLLKNPNVEYVVENFQLQAFRAPVSPAKLKEQWAITKINAEKAWRLAGNKGNRQITVAVIDTGVDYNHESLSNNAVDGYDFRNNDADPMDETSGQNPGHGTHCAGIIGANGVVDGGIIGISPTVSIMPLRFLGADGSGDLMAGIRAIDFAIEKKAQVISASWGAAVPASQAQPLIEAVQRASDAGVIFVAAAANDGKNNDRVSMYPANAQFANTIAVAASGPSDERPNWSNYGRANVSIAAPGLNIMSTLPSNRYGNLSGTSMATPLVSGLVALLLAQDPSLTGADVRALMQQTGAKVSIETACDCRIDAGQAMETLTTGKPFMVPTAQTFAPNATTDFHVKNGDGFTFSSSNPEIADISESGAFTAKKDGDVTITATNSAGQKLQSIGIRVATASSGGGDDGGGLPGLPTDCPIDDPQMCEILCGIMPEAPFCQK
ncbi:MAG: S8 family serine peptidase [Pseudobdellovibrionaceae bacterium]|nr:S8 family serine peptidase [Bdellovibrionales bacterium]USN46499.1 MAG: S8 family serine peptidase [Pseudobdellovibrionaceae bacterium]